MPSKGDKWYMGGTDGSGEYSVIAVSKLGKVGVRNIGDKYGHPAYRIRCEPASWDSELINSIRKKLTWWNGPEGNSTKGNLRFSTVEVGVDMAQNAVAAALCAIEATGTDLNPAVPIDWAAEALGKAWTQHSMESQKQELVAKEKIYKAQQATIIAEAKAEVMPKKKSGTMSELLKLHEEKQKKIEEEAKKTAQQGVILNVKELLAIAEPFTAKLKAGTV